MGGVRTEEFNTLFIFTKRKLTTQRIHFNDFLKKKTLKNVMHWKLNAAQF
jgi:hypothetical protein